MSEGSTRSDGHSGVVEGTDSTGAAGPPGLREFISGRVSEMFARLGGDDCDGLYRLVIGEVEGSLIETVMKETAGNQGRAARILGINRGTLRKKLRAHGLVLREPQPTGGGGG